MSEQILESILGELRNVNVRLNGIDQQLDRMDERFDGIDQRLDRMETTLNEVQVAVLETHSWVGKVAEGQEQHAVAIEKLSLEQGRQGKVIQALAMKSLEHDTDIRELRRAVASR